jgi:hypothetical protein
MAKLASKLIRISSTVVSLVHDSYRPVNSLLGAELLTSVATMAASSHPGLLVMRNRTHNRNPTVTYDRMSSVKANTFRIRPSVNKSDEAPMAIFAYGRLITDGGGAQVGSTCF